MDDKLARELIKKQSWNVLQKFDQLKKEQKYGGVFQGWKEGNIEFAPTYKYSVELDNSYTGDNHTSTAASSGEKRRTPAWYLDRTANFLLNRVVLSISFALRTCYMIAGVTGSYGTEQE